MKKNLSNFIENFLEGKPSVNQKAWDIIHQFYHLILTKMEKDNIKRSDIAVRLNISKAAVSKRLNNTPNTSVLKMVELADAVGLDINLTLDKFMHKEEPRVIVIEAGKYCSTLISDEDSVLVENNVVYIHSLIEQNFQDLNEAYGN